MLPPVGETWDSLEQAKLRPREQYIRRTLSDINEYRRKSIVQVLSNLGFGRSRDPSLASWEDWREEDAKESGVYFAKLRRLLRSRGVTRPSSAPASLSTEVDELEAMLARELTSRDSATEES